MNQTPKNKKQKNSHFDNLIIDGQHLAYRCRFTYNLSNKGLDVSVTYGVIKSIISYIEKFTPNSVIVCWDYGTPVFRKQRVPSYKQGRHSDEDELDIANFHRQLNLLHDIALPTLGIISAKGKYIEADDLIYHASRMLIGTSLVISGDRDLLQCVNDKVNVYNTNGDIIYNESNFEELLGVKLHQFVDFKALQGDGSDNIPGITGVGEKTAIKLLNEFGDISAIYNTALNKSSKENNAKMSESLKSKILSFGWDNIINNVYIMSLHADRVGAKATIINSIGRHIRYNKKYAREFMIKNAFASILDRLGLFETIHKPEIIYKRIPVVYGGIRQCLKDI